mmetsp:Transcript_2717/g.11633  ORF Transcript_2717/g.11633 Transcript_2717/m.11633 type:complete len:379 (+) Transcript_2717:406-1542(+)
MVLDCTGWDMRRPAVAISASLCAARPVGAHISTLRPIARHSRTAMCVAKVFPVPGPPVSTLMGSRRARSRKASCAGDSSLHPSFAAAAWSQRRTLGTSGSLRSRRSRAAMSAATKASASCSTEANTPLRSQTLPPAESLPPGGGGVSSNLATSPRVLRTSAASSSAPSRSDANCCEPSTRPTPSFMCAHGTYTCPSLTAVDCKTCSIAAASRAGSSGFLPSLAARASHRWKVAPRTPVIDPNGSARTRSSVLVPCCAATLCASAGATPCRSRKTMASRRPRVSSQLPLSFSAVFLPMPGQVTRSATASGESKTSKVLAPKCDTSLPAVTLPTPGRAPPARYRRMASSSCGVTSTGVALSWNCMPHLSTSRHSPRISKN